MKRFFISALLVWLGVSLASTALVSQGSPPEIVFIDFPKQIQADGTKVPGFVGFKDPDGNLARADFSIVQAKDLQPFTVDLKHLKGVKEGVFEFQIATQTPQQATLRVILVDEAGNRSQPTEFSFEAVGAGAILQVSPTSLSFNSEIGRIPPTQTLQITNAGIGTMSWDASADQPWISLNPMSGIAPSTVVVSANTAGLAVGSYSGRITIRASGAQNSPAVVIVSLILKPSTPPAVLEVTPTQLEFRGQEGGTNPVAQVLSVRNRGGQPLTWTAQVDKSWLRLNPSTGSLQERESVQVYVYVELAGLSTGAHQAQVTITAPGAQGSPAIVSVTLIVERPAGATIYLTKPVAAPEGAILRLTGPNQFTQVVGNLESPHYIICGPDQRLYVHDYTGGGRILRYNQDGSGRKVIVQDPNLQITTLVFALNGDLYFGTWKQGLWRLKGADPANKPEQILPPSTFTFMPQPYAFLTAGPRKGDLLILDSPWSGGRGVSNRILVARAPDFKVAEPFITTATYWPAGLALNSKSEIFVTMFYDGRIMRYNPDGSVQGTFSALEFANQIAIDSQDTVWVTNAVFRGNEVSGGLVRFKPNGSSEWMLDRVVLVRGVTVCE
uniref:BACON domain-containing protein n=1 Tax=Acetithermum autotrophicum TaxID=1446466 RepID=H5SRM5_ACEAU|nr:hypothetical protein HGMM_OP2C290 [Candidatus Acetothermum autotrophicum]